MFVYFSYVYFVILMLHVLLNKDNSFGHRISRIYSFQEKECTVSHERPDFRALVIRNVT
jgi:hypothetical protein